ncbi:hypothetical protein AS850_12015 [Frondihabitans sp. 762G35]|uniref:alpha/beta hydrolase n=1 Tax=Frondihabitans sp. 762G35 TaxID=1446794 RepID=UPI000D21CAD6|nr:hypothetical protein [Frondihabitans sp. 762G35]ARC57799.1 hypothetical protein AS850_12015 [Frondihabitans sp. 762G35]
MTFLRTGSLPDHVGRPRGEERGTVVLLAGSGESAADFGLLIDQLTLAGFRVEAFDDVSLDPESARIGVLRAVSSTTTRHPHVLVGSDVGATLAAQIAAARPVGLVALVLAGLVTSASRAADAAVVGGLRGGAVGGAGVGAGGRAGVGAGGRLPDGVVLPQPRTILLPSLVFHGNTDDVTDVADAASWATQLPFGAVRVVQRGDHRVLNGDSRRTVAASIVLFLERQRAGEPVLSDGFAS